MPLIDPSAASPEDRVAKNTGIDVRFSPSEIFYGSPAGAPRAGLYMPIDLTFTGGVWTQRHYCTRSLDGDASICPEIRENLDVEDLGSCENAYFAVRLNRIRMWLGLVPSLIPGCADPMGKSAADDTVNGWMKRLPFSEPYRQGCLQVTTDIRVEVDDTAIALADSAEAAEAATTPIALWADANECTEDIDIACSFADCPAIIREGARRTVAAKLRRQLPESLGPHIARYLTSSGGEFRFGTPAFCSLIANPGLDACVALTETDTVPASLARLDFGFFANAFRGMPIVDIQPCLPGYVAEGPSNPWDGCCPAGTQAKKDGFCSADPTPTVEQCQFVACVGFAQAEMPNQRACCGINAGGYTGALPVLRDATYVKVVHDFDRDGRRGADDICPFNSADVDQADTDGDGLGDKCDFCPCSPSETYADADGDGVCSVACPGSRTDNCPAVPNKSQRNINLDAETYSKHGTAQVAAREYGDACEPVPVPEFAVETEGYDVPGGSCQPYGGAVLACFRPTIVTGLKLTPQGSHPTREAVGQTPGETQPKVSEIAREGLRTEGLFCVPGPGGDCAASRVVGRDELAQLASDTVGTAVFRRASITWPDGPAIPPPQPGEDPPPIGRLQPLRYYQTDGSSYAIAWDSLGDLQRWRATSWGRLFVPPASQVGQNPSVPPGRLWLHASNPSGRQLAGYTGAPSDQQDAGYHGLVGSVASNPSATAHLANVYWAGWPVFRKTTLELVRYREDFDVFAVPPCYECRQPEPEAPTDCLVCGLDQSPTDGRAKTIPVLVDPFNPLAMAPDASGAFRDVRRSLSASALAALALPHRAVAATDPLPTSESAARRPFAVLLQPGGNAVADVLYGGSRAIGTQRDLRLQVVEARASTGASVGAANAPAAWPRDGFVAAYNRQRGEVFVLGARAGGRDAELWGHDVDAGSWQRVPLKGNVRVQKPTAAVFLPASNALWVLDESRDGLVRVARLLRIDRATGDVKVAFEYPRLGIYEKQYLVEDRDGRLLLIASSRLLRSHLVLSVTDTGDVASFAAEHGALAYAPIVDGEGYTFFLRGTGATPVVQSMNHLRMRPGRSPDTHRCF